MSDVSERVASLSPEERSALVMRLRRKAPGGEDASAREISRRGQTADAPLSFAQHRLWFLDRLEPDSAAYNLPFAYYLRGLLNVAALERSLNEIVRRHEALRTNFVEKDGAPVQVIAPLLVVPLPLTDLSAYPERERDRRVERIVVEVAERPFKLAAGPLLRAALLKLRGDEHLIVVVIHHIVVDGWSIDIFVRELLALYEAFAAGKPSPLPELPVQYADFAAWQRERLNGSRFEEQLAYWKRYLSGSPPMLEITTDHPRPPRMTYRGGEEWFEISLGLTERLNELSRREGTTLYMTLLAAFLTLLHRYTGQDDLVVGTPLAGRDRAEIENLIGFFVNTLALRTDLSGDPSFRELLRRVREVALGAFAHQDVPFERLVQELQPERAASRHPFFQVMFNVQSDSPELPGATGLQLAMLDKHADKRTRFDLEFHIWSVPGEGLSGPLIYSIDLFTAPTIARLLGHFRTLLEGVAADPDTRLSDLRLLSEAEERETARGWNDTRREYPRDRCVHELFEAQAARTPDAVAVIYPDADERLSYGELNGRANRLAHYLRRRGVGPDVPVGLLMERSAGMIVGLLGILKAGGAYLPLDPSYPAQRLRFMLEDAGARLLLTERRLGEAPTAEAVQAVYLDADWQAISREKAENPPNMTAAENLAYVIYTSGSTGQPKGVSVPHRAVNRLVFNTNYVDLHAGDRVAQASNASFDAATFEIWGALLHGAQLIGVAKEAALSPPELARRIAAQRISVMFLTTALFNQTARHAPSAVASMRYLLFGGEACDPQAARLVVERGKPERLLHVYGPTENTTFSTWFEVREVAESAPTIPIGQPVANTQTYVLDGRLRLVPAGVPGELYLGGDGLARGYLNRPGQTAEKFIPDPFGGGAGARLYRTGDLVRRRADGHIEFLGRLDHQVKLRGFRVELGEIEAALQEHAGVRESVVVARETTSGEKQLVAYVVSSPDDGAPIDDENLRRGQLAHWQMVFDDLIYGRPSQQHDDAFNVTGWNSSYTGEPIPAEEMRVWLEDTLAPLRSTPARRILEVGCGTGLLLTRLAPQCTRYWGTDISRVALDGVRRQVEAAGERLASVSLFRRAADDFTGVEPDSFDAVILNSTVQYFPDVEYLLRVLEKAATAVAPGGFIFVGDVRSLPLMETFHASVQLFKAEDSLPVAELRRRVKTQAAQENELFIAPAFFYALKRHLPRISGVEIRPKRGRRHNELTRFRYQVMLRVSDDAHTLDDDATWHEWEREGLTLDGLRRLLVEQQPEALNLSDVPNARLAAERKLAELLWDDERLRTCGELRAAVAERAGRGIDPEDLHALGEELSYEVGISWARHDAEGSFDVRLRRRARGAAEKPPEGESPFPEPESRGLEWGTYANNPVRGRSEIHLVPQLRSFLHERLPAYMIPSTFVVLDELPLTPNGKIDRRALPAPDAARQVDAESFVAPRNADEEKVAEIWAEVLGVRPVGAEDSFFDLGGHSLQATRVVSRVRDACGVELPLRLLFESPTVAQFAARLAAARQQDEAAHVAEMLERLESLSDDEVDALLEETGGEDE